MAMSCNDSVTTSGGRPFVTTVMGCLLVAVLAAGLTGCSTLQLPAGGLGPFAASQAASTESAEPSSPSSESLGECLILVKPRYGKGTKQTVKITENMLVQQVLEQSGAMKKRRNLEITIFRAVKGSPVPLKMMPEFDAAANSVRPEQNYAIQAGDKILIEESASSVGKTLGRLTGG